MQGTRIKESRKILPVESRIREFFLVESGILAGIQLKESRISLTDLLTYLFTGLFPNWCILKYLRRTILQSSFYIMLFKSVRACPH